MNDLIIPKKPELPATLEELQDFILIGREKLVAVKAQIRVIDKLNLADGVYAQKKSEAQDLADALLDAEIKYGELLQTIKPSHGGSIDGKKGGSKKTLPALTSKKQANHFRTLAKNKEIVDKVKADARENDELPTRTEVLKQVKLNERDAKSDAIKKAREEAAKNFDNLAGYNQMCQIECMRMEEMLSKLPTGTVDAIITDPPYPKEFLPSYGLLAQLAELKKVPLVAVMCGQSHLPQIYEIMSKLMPYVWTMCYHTPGNGTKIWHPAPGLNCNWKPVLLFGKLDHHLSNDMVRSEGTEKLDYEWQQSVSGMEGLIDLLTTENQLVLDPFCGVGSTGVACLKRKRRFIGCDIDADRVKISIDRCKEIYLEIFGGKK